MTSSTRPSRWAPDPRSCARAQQPLPAAAMSILGPVRPAEGRRGCRSSSPCRGEPPATARCPSTDGPDGLPDVHVGVADNQHVAGGAGDGHHGLGDPGLLGIRDQMVHQDAQPAPRAGAEVRHGGGQVVDAVQRFDDDALHPQVVSPDLFHQFGVVLAFHPDPAGLGHLGALALHPDRTGGRPLRRAGAFAGVPAASAWIGCALQQEAEPQPEGPRLAAAVLQRHHVHAAGLLHPGDGADPAGLRRPPAPCPRSTGTSGRARALAGAVRSCGPQFWYASLTLLHSP